jgi:hypothetical protein
MQTSDALAPRYCPRIERVILATDWHPCGTSTGVRMAYTNGLNGTPPAVALQGPVDLGSSHDNLDPSAYLPLFDPDGIIAGEIQAIQDDGIYLPRLTTCKVYQPEDAADGHWELLACGNFCEQGSESGSEEEGSGEEEGSEEGEGSDHGSGAPCVTPADMGWPTPTRDGTFFTLVEGTVAGGFCVRYEEGESCEQASGGGAGGGMDGGTL